MVSPVPVVVHRPRDPVAETVRHFYEENHDGIERARNARRYYYTYLTRVLRARLPPGQRVLDIGCGSGHLLEAIEPSNGVGIDLSARAIEAARRRNTRSLHFVQGDGSERAVKRGVEGGPNKGGVQILVPKSSHGIVLAGIAPAKIALFQDAPKYLGEKTENDRVAKKASLRSCCQSLADFRRL